MVTGRGVRWVWVGRVVFVVIVAGLVTYLAVVGLDKADKVSSSIGAVLALTALVAPYLLPRSRGEDVVPDDVEVGETSVKDSGDAQATGGGQANTGAEVVDGDTGAVRVTKSGKAIADGPNSVANTGVRRVPRS
ncbi:hypothetical protein [Amycolatopsis sp. NBC_00438]|uniref:hypothetical protein n=1 Tax=Amycolatopsis sp. NBC_00438 TaxID=2903558 RepID=UPI002E24060A